MIFSFKPLGLGFDVVKRGCQRVKKSFCKVQKAVTKNSYLRNYQKIFTNSAFVEIPLEPATLREMKILMYFFNDLTPKFMKTVFPIEHLEYLFLWEILKFRNHY